MYDYLSALYLAFFPADADSGLGGEEGRGGVKGGDYIL
jgi:hypothetical protein